MIEAIAAMSAALSELQNLAGAATAPSDAQLVPEISGAGGAAATSFGQTLQDALSRVNGTIATADATTKSFASGDPNIPLSDVMVSLEQANLALQMASGVRDKVVAAYTNIMNMQV
ncbi:MAG TPA: flagellar hook-basal body complex protein FliE [Stellaceae bacterium]|jgi:flagellar hook-basal body complex protein FliE|nr:flagellar hook-basal body complex protein FliE [Stellaceae bacterium]